MKWDILSIRKSWQTAYARVFNRALAVKSVPAQIGEFDARRKLCKARLRARAFGAKASCGLHRALRNGDALRQARPDQKLQFTLQHHMPVLRRTHFDFSITIELDLVGKIVQRFVVDDIPPGKHRRSP